MVRLPGAARSSVAAIACVLALAPTEADARRTYCVGGYHQTFGSFHAYACDSAPVRSLHRGYPWHHHNFVANADGCYACWDEQDSTCSTGFLPSHPSFRQVNRLECLALKTPPPDKILFHNILGRDVVKAPPPKPPPVPLRSEVAKVSKGPYAIGQEISLEGAVLDPSGRPRALDAGEFRLHFPGDPSKDQTVPAVFDTDRSRPKASVRLAAGGPVEVTFVPNGVRKNQNEELESPTATQQDLFVGACRFETFITTPAEGVVLPGQALTLKGEIKPGPAGPSETERTAAAGDLGFRLLVPGKPALDLPTQTAGQGVVSASWKVPKGALDDRKVRLELSSTRDDDGVCPGPPVDLQVSALGLVLEAAAPQRCYSGRPCPLTVSVKPAPGLPATDGGRKFLEAPGLQTVVLDGDDRLGPLEKGAARGNFERPMGNLDVGIHPLVVRVSALQHALEASVSVDMRQPLTLRAPALLDLGAVQAGTPWDETCKDLSLADSVGLLDQVVRIEATVPEGCDSEPVASLGGRRVSLTAPIEVAMGRKGTVPFCLQVARCGPEEQPEGASLRISAQDPEFADQVATVAVSWSVTGRPFLSCHGWWIYALLGGLLLACVIYGFVSPREFAPTDQIKLSKKERKGGRQTGQLLRDLPGGRRGFYRHATVWFNAGGAAQSGKRGALFGFAARRNGMELVVVAGGLERRNARTRKYETLDAADGRHELSRNRWYRIGEIYLQIG